MKSEIIDRILSENSEPLYKIIETVKNNAVFQDVMSNIKEEFFINDSIHGISHNERVALLSCYIGIQEGLDIEELKLVLEAAKYHDIGRGYEGNHGKYSTIIIDRNKEYIFSDLNDNEINIIKALCHGHSVDDSRYEEIAKLYGIRNIDQFKKLLNIVKDADALDRVRLPRFGKFDEKYLRTETAHGMIELAENLFREYRNIQQEIPSEDKIAESKYTFSAELRDQLLFDGENYYLLRSLNKTDIDNLNSGNGIIPKIDDLKTHTVQDVMGQIRMQHRKTNLISMSEDPNIVLTYDKTNLHRFVLIKLSKEKIENSQKAFSAGEYLLGVMDSEIERIAKNAPEKVREILENVDRATSIDEIVRIINGADRQVPTSLVEVEQQYLSNLEQLNQSKKIAKCKVLNYYGLMRGIAHDERGKLLDISEFTRIMRNGYSSSEWLYSGRISQDKIINIPQILIDSLALLKQAEFQGKDKKLLREIEQAVLRLAISEEEINQDDYMLEYSAHNDLKNDLTIDRAYEITNGQISYRDTNMQQIAIRSLAEMTLNKRKIIELLKEKLPNIDIEELLSGTYCINQEMVTKQNNRGNQIGRNINFLISEYGYDFEEKTSRQILESVENLKDEQLNSIISQGVNAQEIRGLLIKTRENDERIQTKKSKTIGSKYIAEAIIEGYNWKKDGNTLTKAEKVLLINTILTNVNTTNKLYKLYDAISHIQVGEKKFTQNDIFGIIINIAIDKKIGDISYNELCQKSKKEIQEILLDNNAKLQTKVLPISVDLLHGNGKEVNRIKKTMHDYYEIPKEIIEMCDIKNLYYAQKIVEEFCEYKSIDDDVVKKALLKSLIMPKSMNKVYANYLSRLVDDVQYEGLSKMEAYSFILNSAIDGSAVEGEKNFSYALLLMNTGFCCQKISEQTKIKKDVSDLTIRKALVKYRKSNINDLIEKAENLKQSEIDNMVDSLIEKNNIKREFFVDSNNELIYKPENICIAYNIVERFCKNKKINDDNITGILLRKVLNSYCFSTKNTGKFSTFLHNMEMCNLSEDEIYETIIALRINEKTDNGYTIRDLYSNNDNIWQKIFENNIDIRTYTNDFSIHKCVAEDIDKDLLIEQIGMPNESLSFEYLKNKAAPNIYLSKMIAEEYCKSNNIEDNRVKRMIMYAVLSNKQLDYVAKGLTNIIDNLLQSGFNKEQINEIIINSAIGEALQFNGKSYSYSTFINNSDGILNKISSENNINLLGKVNLKKLENYYENIEYSQMSLFSYKTNQMETIFISQEEQENIYTELEDLGLNREFIEEKEIRNVYCTRWAVKTYCDKNNITDKDVIGALIFSILDRKVLNKDRTQYLHTLINNLSSMQLEEEELCALIINLGVTNSSMIADVGGYSFNSLLGNSNNCIEKLGDFFGDLRLEVEDKTITMALERFKESALKEVIEKSKNLDETEVEALKDHLSQIGISDEVMKGKSSRNIYISNWIVEQYCDKHEIADIKIKKMFTLAVLDVDSLNESTTYISTLLEKMKIEGLEDDDICGIILNLAGNSMARKTNGISYIGLLQVPNTVADVLKDNNLPSEISEINMATFISESLDEEEKEKMYEKLNELEILKEIQKEKSDNNLYIALWILEKYCSNHDISDNKTKNKILTKILKNKSLNEGGYMTLSTILQSFERIEWNQDEIVEMLVECTKTGKIIIDDNKFTYSQLLRTPYKISESIKGMEHIFSGIERKIDGKDIMEASMELLAKGRGGSQICDDVQADYMRLLDEKTKNNQKEGSEHGELD